MPSPRIILGCLALAGVAVQAQKEKNDDVRVTFVSNRVDNVNQVFSGSPDVFAA